MLEMYVTNMATLNLKDFTQLLLTMSSSKSYIEIYLMPFFNHSMYLGSIFYSLEKYPLPVLIVDDGSVPSLDITCIPIEYHKFVHVLKLDTNSGIQNALNSGIDFVSGIISSKKIIVHRIDADEIVYGKRVSPMNDLTVCHHSYIASLKPWHIFIPPLAFNSYYSWLLLFENQFIHSCSSIRIDRLAFSSLKPYGYISINKSIKADGAEDYLLWNVICFYQGCRSWKGLLSFSTSANPVNELNVNERSNKSCKYAKAKSNCFQQIYFLYTSRKINCEQCDALTASVITSTSKTTAELLSILCQRFLEKHRVNIFEKFLIRCDCNLRKQLMLKRDFKAKLFLYCNPMNLLVTLLSRQHQRSILHLLNKNS